MLQKNRSKRKHGPFLVIQLALLWHPKFNALKYSEQRIFIELLAEASYQNQNGPPKTGHKVQASYSLIQKHTGAAPATISSALKTLKEQGFIKKLNSSEPESWLQGEDATGEFEVDLDWLK